jgi:hypothetical protein
MLRFTTTEISKTNFTAHNGKRIETYLYLKNIPPIKFIHVQRIFMFRIKKPKSHRKNDMS